MTDRGLTERPAFLVERRHQDEATILAEAVREGIQRLYEDTLIESYLLGSVPRQRVLEDLGQSRLEEIEYQRDAIARDAKWALKRD